MECGDQRQRFVDRSGFQKRVQALQSHGERLLVHFRRLRPYRSQITGLFWLGGAALLGAWGYELARTEALEQWENSHLPSLAVWDHGLAARGKNLLRDSKKIERVLRNFPTLTSATGTVWVDPGVHWVALAEADSLRFYCDDCREVPAQWESAGRGWGAMEKILQAPTVVSRPKNSPVLADPREIRY